MIRARAPRAAAPGARARRRASLWLRGSATLVALAAMLPLAYLIVRAAGAPDGIVGTIATTRTAGLVLRTVVLVVAVTATTTVLGVTLAWLTERTDLPGARAWTVGLALPLVVPSYVGAYVLLAAFGARGIVASWIPAPTGLLGAWLVLSLFTYPYVYLSVRAGFRTLDPSMEEAARALGRSPSSAFRSVVLPQLRPSIAAGATLVALYALHDFGAVSLLRYDTFTRAIFVRYTASFDRASAAALALVLVALAIVVVAAEARTRSAGVAYRVHGAVPRPAPRRALGRARPAALAVVSTIVGLGVVLPAAVAIAWLLRAPGGFPAQAALNSARAAAIAAVVTVVAAFPVALLAARYPGRLARALEASTYLAFALPGLVVALSLSFFGIRAAPGLYQTSAMLIAAYVVLFLSHAVGSLRAGVARVSPALEEVAASLGSPRRTVITRVLVPLVRPATLAALTLVSLTVMKELPATLLLAPTGFETLATRVWSATSTGSFAAAAPPALALLVVSSVPLALLLARGERPA